MGRFDADDALASLEATFVPLLLTASSPADIARYVVTVIVDSIQGIFWPRRVADVGIKGFKGVHPFCVNFDTTILIITLVTWMSAISDPGLHGLPSTVDFHSAHTMRLPASAVSLTATTAGGGSSQETLPPRAGFISAIALAKPTGITAFTIRQALDNNQHTKTLTCQIFESTHAHSLQSPDSIRKRN